MELTKGKLWLALAAWTLLASVVAAGLYAWDKRAARLDRRRIPEGTLLWWSLLGGWPGAVWAGRWIRHKTQKSSYRWRFFACVAMHLLAVCVLVWLSL